MTIVQILALIAEDKREAAIKALDFHLRILKRLLSMNILNENGFERIRLCNKADIE